MAILNYISSQDIHEGLIPITGHELLALPPGAPVVVVSGNCSLDLSVSPAPPCIAFLDVSGGYVPPIDPPEAVPLPGAGLLLSSALIATIMVQRLGRRRLI